MSESRDAFVKKMKAKLDEWNAEIDKLEARSRQKEADLQGDYQQRIADLKTRRHEARQRLEKLQNAGESAWEDLKSGVELAAGAVADSLRSARDRFQ
jgi:predicted nuclease with TOPRIM domain